MGEALLMNHRRKKKSEGLKYYDTFTTIGATETIEGATYNEAGYFGTVSANELFTGTELASAVGITQGIVQHDNIEWLKFYIDGKIIFRPMKPIRYSISWDTLNKAGCVFGEKIISKNGITFKVRLMKGSLTDPSYATKDNTNTLRYSEWNRLILPIHQKSLSQNWSNLSNVESDIPNWNIGLTDEDLLIGTTYGNGYQKWCQETDSDNVNNRLFRGDTEVSFAGSISYNFVGNQRGWCPVLEVIPPTE